MSELGRIVAAPLVIESGGEKYLLSPLTLGDLGEFSQWAADRHIALIEKRIAVLERNGVCTPEQKSEMLKKAFDEIDAGRAESRAAMSFEGSSRLGWMSLKKQHPDMTIEKASQIVTLKGLKEFQSQLDRISGLEASSDPNPAAPAMAGADTKDSAVTSSKTTV